MTGWCVRQVNDMLIEFSVENYLSFKEMVTLSLEASSSKELPNNVMYNAGGTGINLLRSAVIYGANASGKSNLLKALSFMAYYVAESFSKKLDTPTGVTPFKLDACQTDKPSTFEISFIASGVRYLYGFSLDKDRVFEEWLHSFPYNRKRLLFERSILDGGKGKRPREYTFGEHWSGEKQKIADMTRPDSLFITTASQLNHPIAEMIVNWFSGHLRSADSLPQGKSEERYTIKFAEKGEKTKDLLLQFLKHADLGIVNFELNEVPFIESRVFRTFPQGTEIPKIFMKEVQKQFKLTESLTVSEVITYRKGTDKNGKPTDVAFQFEEESQGTQKYFVLAGPLLFAITNGSCLISDELDIQLHPILTRAIVGAFHKPTVNDGNGQLIFATHDVSLIENREIFRRDQIWFTEKDRNGSTELSSAWDYKIRKNENIGRGYLTGRYGAIPFIERIISNEES